jgi:hypothetical protein
MAEYYEFHDSYLKGIDHGDRKLVLRVGAYRHTWPGKIGVGEGTGWMQEIEITVENPIVTSDLNEFPLEILDGSLKAQNIQADAVDLVEEMIPSSLSGSGDAEIHMEGVEESSGEYRHVTVCGTSSAITHKKPARFVEELNPW